MCHRWSPLNYISYLTRIIFVGIKPFNIYSLSAWNRDLDIHLYSFYHHHKNDFTISVSEDNKKRGITRAQKKVGNFVQTVEDSQSSNLIVANSPNVRAYQEFEKYDLGDIAQESVDVVSTSKIADFIPLLPFVKTRNIFIKKEEFYFVQLRADSKKEIEKVEQLFYDIVSA